jgi:hypothetical protein
MYVHAPLLWRQLHYRASENNFVSFVLIAVDVFRILDEDE